MNFILKSRTYVKSKNNQPKLVIVGHLECGRYCFLFEEIATLFKRPLLSIVVRNNGVTVQIVERFSTLDTVQNRLGPVVCPELGRCCHGKIFDLKFRNHLNNYAKSKNLNPTLLLKPSQFPQFSLTPSSSSWGDNGGNSSLIKLLNY